MKTGIRCRVNRFIGRNGGWRTRLGFYVIVGAEVFKHFNYNVPISVTIIGFATLLLGIAHKLDKRDWA